GAQGDHIIEMDAHDVQMEQGIDDVIRQERQGGGAQARQKHACMKARRPDWRRIGEYGGGGIAGGHRLMVRQDWQTFKRVPTRSLIIWPEAFDNSSRGPVPRRGSKPIGATSPDFRRSTIGGKVV